ncbi:MAG: hypothetical protein RLZZ630_1706 [Bacteroidota bacterium]|jgi:hypothetical protein
MSDFNVNLVQTILSKGGLSKDVTDKTYDVLQGIKKVLKEFETVLKREVGKSDSRIRIHYKDRSNFEAEIKVADDMLLFVMHSNALVFDHGHPVWKNSYVRLDESRATVGMISIYNFLSDSFKFERRNDTGHLVARIFVNREGHFFIEGKRQLGVLFNDYGTHMVNPELLKAIVEQALIFSLEIDVAVPGYDAMKEITVYEAMVNTMQSTVSTGKRLGFKFEGEGEPEA